MVAARACVLGFDELRIAPRYREALSSSSSSNFEWLHEALQSQVFDYEGDNELFKTKCMDCTETVWTKGDLLSPLCCGDNVPQTANKYYYYCVQLCAFSPNAYGVFLRASYTRIFSISALRTTEYIQFQYIWGVFEGIMHENFQYLCLEISFQIKFFDSVRVTFELNT